MLFKYKIYLIVLPALFCSCNISPVRTVEYKQFVKRFVVPENFSGSVLVFWEIDTSGAVKIINEGNTAVAILDIPANGILFTSGKVPENSPVVVEFYEKGKKELLINETNYKVHPSSGSSATIEPCGTLKKLIYDAFYVSKQFYKYPDGDEQWKKECIDHQINVDTFTDSICAKVKKF